MTHPTDDDLAEVVAAVQQAVTSKGCDHLLPEIVIIAGAILRPSRALTKAEALAMAAAWQAGYTALGLPLCPHATPRCATRCDCDIDAVPDLGNERLLAAWLPELMKAAVA